MASAAIRVVIFVMGLYPFLLAGRSPTLVAQRSNAADTSILPDGPAARQTHGALPPGRGERPSQAAWALKYISPFGFMRAVFRRLSRTAWRKSASICLPVTRPRSPEPTMDARCASRSVVRWMRW